jgi:hypothetical protein
LNYDKYYRQIYRSENGGETWSRIVEESDVVDGHFPSHMAIVGGITISPNSGRVYVNSYAGLHVYDPDGSQIDTWYGYPLLPDYWADTGAWLGWLNVQADPWIWSQSLNKYTYLQDDSGWIYVSPEP